MENRRKVILKTLLLTAAPVLCAWGNLHASATEDVFGAARNAYASSRYGLPPAENEILYLTEEERPPAEEFGYGERGKGPDFSIGYERVPAEYHTPFSRASWSWNAASDRWDVASYDNSQLRDEKVFPFVFAGFAQTKAISPSFSAGFETGFYIPLSSSRDEWDVPFLSHSSTSPSTAYNYQTEPSTCSALYNSDKRKLLILPVMAVLSWDPPGFLNMSLAAGVYITHLQIESVSGEKFYADFLDSGGKLHTAGTVAEYSHWRSENRIIPAVKYSVSTHLKVSENSDLKLSFSATGLKKTDFLFQDYDMGGKTFRDGVVIGGVSYGFSAGWKILF